MKTLEQLLNVVQYLQPEKKGQISVFKQNFQSLLKEMATVNGSSRYEELVESVCDDLIENVNNQIDLHKRGAGNPEAAGTLASTVLQGTLKTEHFSQDKPGQPRTDNTMMKPQIGWWG